MIRGKKILIGVCGSIAAYKIAILTRLLKKEDAEVQIIMTDSALDFITPLTLSTLSKNPVHKNFQDKNSGEWNSHVELGLWADLFIIADELTFNNGAFAKLAVFHFLTGFVFCLFGCSVQPIITAAQMVGFG